MGVFKWRKRFGWYAAAAVAVLGVAFLTYGVAVGVGRTFSRDNGAEETRGAQLSAPSTHPAVVAENSSSSPSPSNGPVTRYVIPPRSYAPVPTERASTSRGAPTTAAAASGTVRLPGGSGPSNNDWAQAGSSSGLKSSGGPTTATGTAALTPGGHWTRGGVAAASATGGASSAGGRSSSTRVENPAGSEGQRPTPPTGSAPSSVDRGERSPAASPTTSQAPSSSGLPGAPSGQSRSVPTPMNSSLPGPTTTAQQPPLVAGSSRAVHRSDQWSAKSDRGDGVDG